MNVTVDVEITTKANDVPDTNNFQHWVKAAIEFFDKDIQDAELGIRIIDETESASLNENFRGKAGATNVLSFPFSSFSVLPVTPLGDLAICAPVVEKEAYEQHKQSNAHWAHMTIHGVLHLLGMDHEHHQDAERMETLEIAILDYLGFENPYLPLT